MKTMKEIAEQNITSINESKVYDDIIEKLKNALVLNVSNVSISFFIYCFDQSSFGAIYFYNRKFGELS